MNHIRLTRGTRKVNKVFDVIITSPVQPGLLFRCVCVVKNAQTRRKSALSYLTITGELLREKGASF